MATPRLGRLPTLVLALAVPLVALVTVVVTLNVTSDRAGTTAARTTPDAITIANFRFSPDPVVVSAGATVTVTNTDGTAHTVTASGGAFDTGELRGGESRPITITKPGTYRYFCNIHNYMTGTIEVR
jgi:plastocyanin